MKTCIAFTTIVLLLACRGRTHQQDDSIYSRHLQRDVKLHIINTPIPADKSTLNLLLLNDGADIDQMRIGEITDSLFNKHLIEPLVIVAIEAGDRMREYGISDAPDYLGRGDRAKYYDAFINDELYPFAKKRAGVRKFKSVAIAGASLGGLSAFDVAWNHADKIDKVGVFSGSFWWRDKDTKDSTYSDEKNRLMFAKLKSSRKKPKLQYWFYAGTAEENGDRDGDGIIDVIDDTKDVINLLLQKKVASPADAVYKETPGATHDWGYWSRAFPGFLVWAFGKQQ